MGKLTAELTEQVRQQLVAVPLRDRLGLQDGDLFGAASAATEALRAGDLEAALKGFAHLVILDPMNADFHAGLAEAALALGHNELALQSASVIVAQRPASGEGYFLSARACFGLGETALALEDLLAAEAMARKSGQSAHVVAAQRMRAVVEAAG